MVQIQISMRLYIKTFGCQMNVHDSARITEIMARAGHETTDDPSTADVLLVNSCSVREKAWHKAISEVGRHRSRKRNRPELIVGLVGCVAEQEQERMFQLLPEVDLVVGPDHYRELPTLLERLAAERERQLAVGFDRGDADDFLSATPTAAATALAVSEFVTVMKGCAERCAYCIVPSVRGPERARPAARIVDEVRELADAGVREVVLLGQKVNAYERDGVDFVGLLEQIDRIPRLARVRFTSPHPRHMTTELTSAYGRLRTLCESIHLPVQAGADTVLARMRRRYTVADYLDVVARLRAACPKIGISTDLIVGYPGETAAEFEQTLALIERVRFTGVFSFMYSPRAGTPAARLSDSVPPAEKSRRLAAVHEVVAAVEGEWRAAFVGRTLEVLVESAGRRPAQLSGRARNNQIVNFDPPVGVTLEEWRGALVPVEIVAAHPHSLEGRAAGSPG